MERTRPAGPMLAAVLVAAAFALGSVAAPAFAGAGAVPLRGGPPSPGAAPALPPDWPADVPLPPGAIQGSTGRAPQWSVLLLVSGAAAPAHRDAIAFYRAHGFTADTDSIVHRGPFRITVVVENRDHSPNETFLAIALSQTADAQPSPAPSVLPGRPSIGLAEARRAGLPVAFVAPAGARTARVLVLRRGRPIASKTVTVRTGRNSVVVRSAALRRRLRPGRYVLQVVLRAANGAAGTAGSTGVRVTR